MKNKKHRKIHFITAPQGRSMAAIYGISIAFICLSVSQAEGAATAYDNEQDSRISDNENTMINEVTRATASEAVNAADIAAENARATAAEDYLTNQIACEADERVANDTGLEIQISITSTELADHETRITNNEQCIAALNGFAAGDMQDHIDQNTDKIMDNTVNIMVNTIKIDDEADSRAIADTVLMSDICNEATRATDAEAANAADIAAITDTGLGVDLDENQAGIAGIITINKDTGKIHIGEHSLVTYENEGVQVLESSVGDTLLINDDLGVAGDLHLDGDIYINGSSVPIGQTSNLTTEVARATAAEEENKSNIINNMFGISANRAETGANASEIDAITADIGANTANIDTITADINAIISMLADAGIGTNPTSTPGVASGQFSSGFTGDNFVIQWASSANEQYQIQSSTNLIDWVDEGEILTGTGAPMSWANPIVESQGFYRVIGK